MDMILFNIVLGELDTDNETNLICSDDGDPPVARPDAAAAEAEQPGPALRVEGAGSERHEQVARRVIRRDGGERKPGRRRERGAPRAADGAAGSVALERAAIGDACDESSVDVGPPRHIVLHDDMMYALLFGVGLKGISS